MRVRAAVDASLLAELLQEHPLYTTRALEAALRVEWIERWVTGNVGGGWRLACGLSIGQSSKWCRMIDVCFEDNQQNNISWGRGLSP